jgi:hypothetical protein
VPDERQLKLDFGAGQRDAERLAAMPPRLAERRDQLLAASVAKGRDDKGKPVGSWTLKLILLSINSFGDECYASTESIGIRCSGKDEDGRDWTRLVPNGRKLSARTVKSGIQALYILKPFELLDRVYKGTRNETRRILWQYVGKRARMGEPATPMGELATPMGELATPMGELSSPQLLTRTCLKETAAATAALQQQLHTAGVDQAEQAIARA